MVFRAGRVVVAVSLVVAGMLGVAGPAQAGTEGRSETTVVLRLVPSKTLDGTKVFRTQQDIHAGDCTLFHGAEFTYWSDGSMVFHGRVTSSDDHDRWVMQIRALDANGNFFGYTLNRYPTTPNDTEFVTKLVDSSQQYDWAAIGQLPRPSWYAQMVSIQLHSTC